MDKELDAELAQANTQLTAALENCEGKETKELQVARVRHLAVRKKYQPDSFNSESENQRITNDRDNRKKDKENI